MINDAVTKLTTEANSIGGHALAMAEHLIDTMTDASAEKILASGKTLAGAISHVTENARKQKSGNMAMIRDDVVYGWLNEYYGITPGETKPVPATQTFMENGLQVDLMDLL